jgi:hypothetical protein
MVDTARGVLRMKHVPMASFVGMDDTADRDKLFNESHAVCLCLSFGRKCPALALASNDDNAALPCLMLCTAPVNAIHFEIFRPDVSAEVGAVNFDSAGKGFISDFRCQNFTELVSENESRLVLAIEIPCKLNSGKPLHAVCHDDDRREKVNEAHLAAGEDRAGRDAELMAARLALELAARGARVLMRERLETDGCNPSGLQNRPKTRRDRQGLERQPG